MEVSPLVDREKYEDPLDNKEGWTIVFGASSSKLEKQIDM